MCGSHVQISLRIGLSPGFMQFVLYCFPKLENLALTWDKSKLFLRAFQKSGLILKILPVLTPFFFFFLPDVSSFPGPLAFSCFLQTSLDAAFCLTSHVTLESGYYHSGHDLLRF